MKPDFQTNSNIINVLKPAGRLILIACFLLFSSISGYGQLIADFVADNRITCIGQTVTFTDNSTLISDSTVYYWDFGAGASPASAAGEGPHIVSYTGSGNITVSLTLTDTVIVTDTKTDYITVNPVPAVPEVLVTDNCDNTSTLAVTIEGELLWSTMETTPSIIVTAPGTYTVTTTTDGCTSLQGSGLAAPKTTPAAPSVTVVDNCNGTSTLSTTADGNLLWSTMQSSSSIIVISAGIFTVTTTVNECTSLPGSGTAAPKTSPDNPVVSVDCTLGYEEAVINITSPLGEGFEYRLDGGTFQSGTSFTGVNNGSHTVTVRNPSGCTTTGEYFEVSCGCINGATVTLSSISGATCNVTPVTIADNTFGGIATWVLITEDGNGSVSPSISFTSPFSFTYTPRAGDAGEIVKITVTTNNPPGGPCVAAKETYLLSVNTNPDPPVPGLVIQPTCSASTGSVIMNGLPATGTWSLIRSPGGVTVTGNGTSTTISDILSGTYTFTVSNETGCISESSESLVIAAQPQTPEAPVAGTISHPTCTLSTGSVVLNGLPEGTWIINPGGINGSTTSKTISGLSVGTHIFSVTNSSGCTSDTSSDIVINAQPGIPAPPSVGVITSPTCTLSTGSVVLDGLTAEGTWTLTRYPGTIALSGTGTSKTISDLPAGTYNFTLSNEAGCLSAPSVNVVINSQPSSPAVPVQTIDCILGFGKAAVNVTSPTGAGIEYSLDGGTYRSGTSFANVINGNHIITARNSLGCVTAGPVFAVSCGCVNLPVIVLSSSAGTTCGTTMVSVSGNTFSGSTTAVNITENGGGTVSPSLINVSPFTFTYTPSESDKESEVTITLTTNNPLGTPCSAATATYILTVNTSPTPPSAGTITQVSCTISTGSVVLNGLPATGTWALTSNPGLVKTTGTGTSSTISGLAAGTHTYTVTSSAGCTSAASADIVINSHSGSPAAPAVGTITPPTCELSTGSVALSGLPATGTWTLTRNPGTVISTGTGPDTIISGLLSGTYYYTVTNGAGCVSVPSNNIIIPVQPAPAIVVVTNPALSCEPGKADLRLPGRTAGSTPGMTFTYWTDSSATLAYPTPSAAGTGTYFIKGTTATGCYDIKPVTINIYSLAVADAGKDKFLDNERITTMDAKLAHDYETGVWSIISGTGDFLDKNNPNTSVSRLSLDENIFLWKVTNGVCPDSSDIVMITVRDLDIQTLITPNMDGKNDYFLIKGLDTPGKTELVVFDRRGAQVYKNENYDNLWNGVDYNDNPLQDDTYFYILKPGNGKSYSGFIVIRK